MKKRATWILFVSIVCFGCEHTFIDLTPDIDADADSVESDGNVDSNGSDADFDSSSDDTIDVGDTSDCDPALLGLSCEVGVGECRRTGVTVCLSPGSVGCSATPGTPATEICDDLDNDCDGESDEDLVGCCTVGEHASCGTDVGECEFGEKECLPGEIWSECRGGRGPVAESCDSRDNDCDGLTDEDWDLTSDVNNCGSCGNVCNLPHASIEGCSGGSCVVLDCEGFNSLTQYFNADGNHANGCEYACACSFITIGHEIAATFSDDDCDGRTDEILDGQLVAHLGFFNEMDDSPGCDVLGDAMIADQLGHQPPHDYAQVRDRRFLPQCSDGVLSHRRCYPAGPMTPPDYGFLFDGVDDYLFISDSTDLDSISSAFTYFIWVKPLTLEDGDYVIWREPADQFSLKMRNVGGHFKWQFCLSSSVCGNTTSDIALDTWTLLVFTYSASTVRIYVNAVEEALFTGSFTPGGEMRIGGDGSNHYYHGSIDEIALYNIALPVSDISWYFEFAHPRP
jgi:hypothetical protein